MLEPKGTLDSILSFILFRAHLLSYSFFMTSYCWALGVQELVNYNSCPQELHGREKSTMIQRVNTTIVTRLNDALNDGLILSGWKGK